MNYTLTTLDNMLKFIYCKMHIRDNRQKSINLIIIGGLFLGISSALGQNTTIVFNTKANVTIGISKEIDNTYTSRLTDEIDTDTTGSCVYSWNLNDFQFMDCSFHDGGRAYFPIKEGSHLIIKYKGDHQIEFAGADKTEVEFYTNSYKKDIIQPFIGSLFTFPAESNFEDFSLLIEKHYSVLSDTLDCLVAEDVISPKFSDILKNEFHTLTTCLGIEIYRSRYLDSVPTKVNEQDSVKVENLINGILDKISPMIDSGDILKYNLGRSSLAVFYTNKYRHLDETDKENLFSKNIWANHLSSNKLGYLIAPEEIQYKLLSLELLDNYENAVIRGDSTFINHISEIRSQNTFLPYIKEKRNKLLLSMNADISGVKYIENIINTLEELSKIDDLDQKVLYIDMWATWCGPCIEEFKHRDKINKLLLNYKDIIPVYISFDDDKNDIAWKEKTKAFNLNGYHLRANNNLVTYINKKLYEGKGIGVPHYILLDKNGNILERNLSRPSNIDKLKEELDKHLK
ncbi:TlpA family protein disulfide reductase [Dysgonomonas sp. Marseille-P4677]|uniref:TlpA family protein disulfide reductase n=1 Tax=Dysgonomonas sp. Marseille-P4677 TaxID=2364790 RepID=UPI0019130E51|nr:TlpA disulfide reductase family protein [Dysgonomonas sp. Marseille-P4677]MBK5723086.1 TlpA family protein disulfide reductase [Dysgonomonas sp. Marseille-P4677]